MEICLATSRSGLSQQRPLEEGRASWSCRASADSGRGQEGPSASPHPGAGQGLLGEGPSVPAQVGISAIALGPGDPALGLPLASWGLSAGDSRASQGICQETAAIRIKLGWWSSAPLVVPGLPHGNGLALDRHGPLPMGSGTGGLVRVGGERSLLAELLPRLRLASFSPAGPRGERPPLPSPPFLSLAPAQCTLSAGMGRTASWPARVPPSPAWSRGWAWEATEPSALLCLPGLAASGWEERGRGQLWTVPAAPGASLPPDTT